MNNKKQKIFASFVWVLSLVLVPQSIFAYGGYDGFTGAGSYTGYSTGSGGSYGGYSSGTGGSYTGYSSGGGSSYTGYSSGSGSYGGYSSGTGGSYTGYSAGTGTYGGYSSGGDATYDGYSSGGGANYNGYSSGGGATFGGYSTGNGATYGGYSSGGGATYDGYSTGTGGTYSGYSDGAGGTYTGYSTGDGGTYSGYSTGNGATYSGYSTGNGGTYNPSYNTSNSPSYASGNTGATYAQGGSGSPSYGNNGSGNNGNGNPTLGYHNSNPNNGCSNCEEEYFPEDECPYLDDCYEEEPISVVCVPAHVDAEIGESVTFTANVDGGYGNYQYDWSGSVNGTSRSITRSFDSEGSKTAYVTVRSGNRSASAMCTVDVEEDEDLDAVCIASPDEVEEGEEVVWRVNATGGNGNYTYNWSGDVNGNNRTEHETYSTEGRKTATVRVTSGGRSINKTCSVRVIEEDADDFRAVCEVTPDNPEEGELVTWKVRVSGGDGDYDFQWTGDVTGDNRTETKRYNSPGRKTATVRVESDGKTIRKTCNVYIDEDDRVIRNTNPSNITLVQSTPTIPPGTLSSGVFLSDLPYTGVKETMKIALFFLGLILWSALIAYIFIKRNAEKKMGRKVSNKEMIDNFKAQNLARKSFIA